MEVSLPLLLASPVPRPAAGLVDCVGRSSCSYRIHHVDMSCEKSNAQNAQTRSKRRKSSLGKNGERVLNLRACAFIVMKSRNSHDKFIFSLNQY